jgi:hypothetical protein
MYDYQNNDGGVYDYWVEFEVVFIDGVIDKIKPIKFEINDNTKRKELHKQHIEELKNRKVVESTMFYRLVIKPYNKIIRFVTRHVSKFATFLLSVCYKIESKLIV